MNIREAILKAADHIEANPGLFNFEYITVPGCGSPGCALGWIGAFYGIQADETICRMSVDVMGIDSLEFYGRMREIARGNWRETAAGCAANLRLYANKYHPEQLPSISAELDRIFSTVRESAAA